MKGDGQLKFDRDVVGQEYCIVLGNQLHDFISPMVTVPTRWCHAVRGGTFGELIRTTEGRWTAEIRRRCSKTGVLQCIS